MNTDCQFDHVCWIGGSSCSGKSSQAEKIAKRFGFSVYHTDEHAFGEHMFGLSNEAAFPAVTEYKNLLLKGIDDFAERATDVSFRAFIRFCHEVFPLILKDLAALPRSGGVIVEGAHLFPELVSSVTAKGKAVFIVATPEFRETIWQKEMRGEIPGGNKYEIENYNNSSKKKLIEEKHAAFHQMVAEYIQKGARRLSLPRIISDGSLNEEDLTAKMTERLSLA